MYRDLKYLAHYKRKDPYSMRSRVETIEFGYHVMQHDE